MVSIKLFEFEILIYRLSTITRVNTPWGTFLLKCDALRGLEQLRSQPNDTRIPQILKMQYLHK